MFGRILARLIPAYRLVDSRFLVGKFLLFRPRRQLLDFQRRDTLMIRDDQRRDVLVDRSSVPRDTGAPALPFRRTPVDREQFSSLSVTPS